MKIWWRINIKTYFIKLEVFRNFLSLLTFNNNLCSGQSNETVDLLKDYIHVMGLTYRQAAAILGAGYSMAHSGPCDGFFCQRNSFLNSTSSVSVNLSNVYFNDLLNHQWEEFQVADRMMYKVM